MSAGMSERLQNIIGMVLVVFITVAVMAAGIFTLDLMIEVERGRAIDAKLETSLRELDRVRAAREATEGKR